MAFMIFSVYLLGVVVIGWLITVNFVAGGGFEINVVIVNETVNQSSSFIGVKHALKMPKMTIVKSLKSTRIFNTIPIKMQC